ncbi:MAG TPA: hypothetical protein ENN87_13185 [Phycisphaerales bacterium]|nr:hypothetical protein [Phycisphaerales bacterium]
MGLLRWLLAIGKKGRYHYPQETIITVGNIDPKYDRLYKAASRSEQGKWYKVNVQRLTCSCPDWQKRRSAYPPGDVRRVCKHVYDKLYQTGVEKHFDDIVRLLIRYGRRDRHFFRVDNARGTFVFGFTPGVPWVRVFAKVKGESVVGSYNMDEHRWAYDEVPQYERLLVQEIRAVFGGW